MKKIIVVILMFSLVFCLFGCGNSSNNEITCQNCGEVCSNQSKFCSSCGATLESSNGNTGTEKTVTTAKEFLNNIADNTTITISANSVNLKNVSGVNNSKVEKSEDGRYVISNVNNLTIQGTATLLANDLSEGMLEFDNCSNITFSGLSFDCNSQEECYLSYIEFIECSNVTVKDCNFSNAGGGTHFYNSENTNVINSNFNSVFSGVSSYFSDTKIEECIFDNCSFVFQCRESNFYVNKSKISGAKDLNMIVDETESAFDEGVSYKESIITFEECTFENNALTSFFAKEDKLCAGYLYSHNNLKFKNCNFKNNIYCYGTLTGSNFVNCTFSNNRLGIDVWDFSGWDLESVRSCLSGTSFSTKYAYEDITSDCQDLSEVVVSQNVMGVVDKSTQIIFTLSKPAVTIEQINIDINSANGVEPSITYTNHTDKQIAYIFFTIKFYDRMGSPAYCSIYDTHTRRVKVTGPINAGVQKTSYWEPIIYNSATAAMKPLKIEVEFTDGTKQVITCTGRYWYTGSYYGGDLRD